MMIFEHVWIQLERSDASTHATCGFATNDECLAELLVAVGTVLTTLPGSVAPPVQINIY